MQNSVNALPAGFRIKDYEIVEELGSGGFGITYKAYDASLQTFVAIKEYLPVHFAVRDYDTISVAPRSGAVAREYNAGLRMFLGEARTLAHFRHNRIIRVIQYLQANNTAYLVMEYEQGASLSERVTDPNYPINDYRILLWMREVLEGLEVIHRSSFLHRDIKPSNIYIRDDHSPVLLDFGSARFALSGQSLSLTSIVTPGYAPLEQYHKDGKQGPWTDFYGLGATFYWVVTGNRPVAATDRFVAATGDQSDPNLPATNLARGRYRQPLLKCIDWMLEPKIENRPQNSGAIINFLQTIDRTEEIHPPTVLPGESTQPYPAVSRYRGIFSGLNPRAVTIAFVACVIGFGLLAIWMGPGSSFGTDASQNVPESFGAPGETIQSEGEGVPADENTGRPNSIKPEALQKKINDLIKAGDKALAERRLTTPVKDSAAHYFEQVLILAPNNLRANVGRRRIVESYVQLAEGKWRRGDYTTAREYLRRASQVEPENPSIPDANQRMVEYRNSHPNAQYKKKSIHVYPNLRSAKNAYRRGMLSKSEYATVKRTLDNRYKRRLQRLKRLYRQGRLTKSEYRRQVRIAKKDYAG